MKFSQHFVIDVFRCINILRIHIFHFKFQNHYNPPISLAKYFNMDTAFDVHASVPAEVWTLGQLNAQKANLINTMEAAKSSVQLQSADSTFSSGIYRFIHYSFIILT